jgi:ABC-type dipeptide/oligopeptide/nickel transport system permease component
MGQYLLRRILLAVPVLIGIIFLTFALVRAIPGDPCRAMMGENATVSTTTSSFSLAVMRKACCKVIWVIQLNMAAPSISSC